jgi:hypothetical protein
MGWQKKDFDSTLSPFMVEKDVEEATGSRLPRKYSEAFSIWTRRRSDSVSIVVSYF